MLAPARGGLIFVFVLLLGAGGGNDIQWCFSQVKGAVDDDVAEGKSNIFLRLFFYCVLTFEPLLRHGDVFLPRTCYKHLEQNK